MDEDDFAPIVVLIIGGLGVFLALSWLANQVDMAKSGTTPDNTYKLEDLHR